jgi:hypothetical protein
LLEIVTIEAQAFTKEPRRTKEDSGSKSVDAPRSPERKHLTAEIAEYAENSSSDFLCDLSDLGGDMLLF